MWKESVIIIKEIISNLRYVKFETLDKLLKLFGYKPKQLRRGSSHYVYRKPGANPITVPYKRPFLKEVYIKHVIKILNLEEFYEKYCRKD